MVYGVRPGRLHRSGRLLAGADRLDQGVTRADREEGAARRSTGPVDPVDAAGPRPDPDLAGDHPTSEIAEALQKAHVAAPPGMEPTHAGSQDRPRGAEGGRALRGGSSFRRNPPD